MDSVPRRPGTSWQRVFAGLVITLALAGVAALAIYHKYIRYDRVAALHLPPDTTLVVRVQVEHRVLYEPARKHLIPLLDTVFHDPRHPTASRTRLERWQDVSALELAAQLREVVWARGPTDSDWLLVLGGKFVKRRPIAGLYKVLSEEGLTVSLSADGTRMSGPRGVAVAQVDDGCIVIASSDARLTDASRQQLTYQTLGLDLTDAAAFALRGELLRPLAESPLSALQPALADLRGAERLHGSVRLGAPELVVTVRLDLAAGREPAAVQAHVQTLLAATQSLVALTGWVDHAGERRALEHATSRAVPPTGVELTMPWLVDDLDRGAERLVAAAKGWAATPTP